MEKLPCRTDTQIETPFGAFALNEWLREGRVLLKNRHRTAAHRDAVAQGS
nr:phosphoribosyl-dephospho-CoA transferase [Raoultella sp. NCTC 9187]